jgi:hypothetical protein
MRVSILLLVVGTLALNMRANAAYMNGFSGNVKAATSGGAGQITVNYATLDRLAGGSAPGDVYGTGMPGFDTLFVSGGGSPAFDTTARYLYLFQNVVSPTSGFGFNAFFEGGSIADYSSVTSVEQWSLFLSDNAGIVSTTNDFGTDGVAFTETAPVNLGVSNPSISASGAISSLVGVSSPSFTATTFSGSFSPILSVGATSRIVGFTTNVPPGFLTVASQPNYAGSAQIVPVAVPEPISVFLLALGCGGFSIRRRNRRK